MTRCSALRRYAFCIALLAVPLLPVFQAVAGPSQAVFLKSHLMYASVAHGDHTRHVRTNSDAADVADLGKANPSDELCQKICAVQATALAALATVGEPWRFGQGIFPPTGEFWRAAFLERDAPPPRS
jgi:hypothetical protein